VLHRILGIVLVVCGACAIALGVASATAWRTSPTVTATTAAKASDATLVTTAPGVLDLVSDTVRVTAHGAPGEPVVLAVGRTADVTGWVGKDPVVRVDGLDDWSTLSTTTVAGTAPKAVPDPSTSDMWVASETGTGSASMTWTTQPGQWTLLAAGTGDGATAPSLSLTWDRTVTTPYLWPLVLVGVVLCLAGAVVLLLGSARGRSRRQASARAAATAVPAGAAPGSSEPASVQTGATAVTRRELREQAARLAEQEARRNRSRRSRAVAPTDAPAADVEPEPTTVAIPVAETRKGAADAWRRRWNVPARIPPAAPAGTVPDAPVTPPDAPPAPPASSASVPAPPVRTRAERRADEDHPTPQATARLPWAPTSAKRPDHTSADRTPVDRTSTDRTPTDRGAHT
jgi:hypothetical protein